MTPPVFYQWLHSQPVMVVVQDSLHRPASLSLSISALMALHKQAECSVGGMTRLEAFPERQTCQAAIVWSSGQVGWSETPARVVFVFPIHFYDNQRETEEGELSQQTGEVTESS